MTDNRLARAEGLLEIGRFEQALALAGRVLADDPGSHDAAVVVIRALMREERHGEARAASRRLLGQHPRSDQAWRLDALAAARSGDFAAAWHSSRRAVELEPDEWRTHHVAVDVDLLADSPYAQTWRHATEAVRLAPDEPAVHRLAGRVALRTGRLDLAQRAYEEALRLDPQDDVARHELGVIALRKGDDVKAAGDLSSALEADPTDEVTLGNLDIVVKNAFNQIHLWMFFAALGSWAFWVAEPHEDRRRLVALVGVVVALVGGAIHVGRLAHQAGPTFRRYLRSVLRRTPELRRRVAMLAVAACALAWAALGPAATAFYGYAVGLVAVLVGAERGARSTTGR